MNTNTGVMLSVEPEYTSVRAQNTLVGRIMMKGTLKKQEPIPRMRAKVMHPAKVLGAAHGMGTVP